MFVATEKKKKNLHSGKQRFCLGAPLSPLLMSGCALCCGSLCSDWLGFFVVRVILPPVALAPFFFFCSVFVCLFSCGRRYFQKPAQMNVFFFLFLNYSRKFLF